MSEQTPQSKDPLHGKTLKAILTELVERYGWDELAGRIAINCFAVNPSLNSSLTFLRRTPWARAKVENLYLESMGHPGAGRGPKPRPAPGSARSTAKPPAKSSAPTESPAALNPWTGLPYED